MLMAAPYLRPEMVDRQFIIERKKPKRDRSGRMSIRDYDPDGEVFATLALANPQQVEQQRKLGHPCTHTIIGQGFARLKPGDRFIRGSRVFYVMGTDDIDELSHFTLYYCEERNDDNG